MKWFLNTFVPSSRTADLSQIVTHDMCVFGVLLLVLLTLSSVMATAITLSSAHPLTAAHCNVSPSKVSSVS